MEKNFGGRVQNKCTQDRPLWTDQDPAPQPQPLEESPEPPEPCPHRMEKNFGGRVQNKMYPGQTALDQTDLTPQPLTPQWAPKNEEKRTLEGESRTNVPRTDGLRHSGLDPEGTTATSSPGLPSPSLRPFGASCGRRRQWEERRQA